MQTCEYDFCRRTRNTTYQHDNDDDTDLDYAMARYYASRSGRFMTPDPGHIGANVGDPQSWNAYAYAINDPINYIDSGGKWPYWIHDSIYDAVFGDVLPSRALQKLKSASWHADFGPGGTAPENSHKHAMCDFGVDLPKCRDQITSYRQQQLRLASQISQRGGNIDAYDYAAMEPFGYAVHSFTDGGSPAHTDRSFDPISYKGGKWELLTHVLDEISPVGNWFQLGESVRNAVYGFSQAFPNFGGLSEKDYNKWADRAIEDLVSQYFPFMTYARYGGGLSYEAARACALGNPAACIE